MRLVEEPDPSGSVLPLQVDELVFGRNGTAILNGVSFVLERGTLAVILGYNGAGKSVLLRLLNGLLVPDAGHIRWHAEVSPTVLCRRQSLVFQHPVMLRRSVRENLLYPLRVHGYDRRVRARRVDEVLALANLEEIAGRPSRVLSGGELQRVAIARALATGPELLMLDEPTSNLDPYATATVETLLREVHARGTTILMVTQNLGQARRLAGEVIFLHEGRALEQSPAGHFFQSPRSDAARAFIAEQLPGETTSETRSTGVGT